MSTKIGAAVIALLIILGGVVYYFRSDKPETTYTGLPAVGNETDSTATATVADAKVQQTAGAKRSLTPSLSYDEAVTLFGGRRIQFDENCNMEPSQVTFRNDTSVMFDNRASSGKTIRLDDKAYSLGAYDFVIVNLKNRTLPHAISVDCGEGVNNGRITLQ